MPEELLRILRDMLHVPISSLINTHSLNLVVPNFFDGTLANQLGFHPEGLELLDIFSSLISEDTLNLRGFGGRTLAHDFVYAENKGIAILAANDHNLAKKINAQTLNFVITDVYCRGFTLAHRLALSPEGIALLLANNNYLLSKINENTLDLVVNHADYRWQTLRDILLQAQPRNNPRMRI